MKSIKTWWANLPNWAKSRYFIAALLFLVWMAFIDTNSFLVHRKLNREIKDLNSAKAHYEAELSKDMEALEQLSDDPKKLEKFAREKYFMSREGEDVFIISAESELK